MSPLWMALLIPLRFVAADGAQEANLAGAADSVHAAGTGASLGDVRRGLDVPLVTQAPERCGPAALEMVLRYYGADATALGEVARAYDPVLHGSLITDLAAAARRAGYAAEVVTLTPDSLIALLGAGVPPIILYQAGRGPIAVAHYGVVTSWDPAKSRFTLNDGGKQPRLTRRDDLAKAWKSAGSQALIVRRRAT